MIHEVSGDILLSKAPGIAHGIAPNDPFDSGLALALRQKWPMMHKDYRHYAHQTHPKPGELWTWGGFGVRIFNLLTQEGSFDHGAKAGRATISNVNHALRRLRHALEGEKLSGLALPRLATGVGGLEWNAVKPLIVQHLGDIPTPVFLYVEYHAGVAAKEPTG
ncbi:MAG: macro domain-containing protein [Planctomycetales bacterium]